MALFLCRIFKEPEPKDVKIVMDKWVEKKKNTK